MKKLLEIIKKLFSSECIDYSKPYSSEESKFTPKLIKDGYYIDSREPSKHFKILTNKYGNKFKKFDDGRTESFDFSTYSRYITAVNPFSTIFIGNGTMYLGNESNIGYNNSKL